MFSSPYTIHVISGLALTSISMNLVSLRRTTEEEQHRVSAQLSLLGSIRQQLLDAGNDVDGKGKGKGKGKGMSTEELERLVESSRVSRRGEGEGEGEGEGGGAAQAGTLGGDVSWSAIFGGKAPVVSEETSRWDKEDLETLRKELAK